MAGIDGLDVMERTGPYRDPRAAFGRKPGSPVGIGQVGQPASPAPRIPVGQATEIYDPLKTQVARTSPYKPNFTTGGGIGDMPQRAAPPQLQGGPGRSVIPSTRPNFTMQPNIEVLGNQPRLGYTPPTPPPVTPQPLGSAGPQANRTSFQGPVRPAGAAPVVPPAPTGIAGRAPTRMAAVAGKVATALPGIAGGVLPAVANAAYNIGPAPSTAPLPARDPNAARVPGTNDIIPRDPNLPANYTVPAAPEGNVFRDTEAGRNIGNLVNAIPGIGRLPGAMLRAGSTASKALGIGGEVVRGTATSNVLGAPGAPTLPAPPSITAQVAPQEDGPGRGKGFVDPRDLRTQQPDKGIAAPVAAAPDTSLDITRGMPNASAISPSLEAELSAARMAAAGREDRPAGIAGFADSATEERNARLARDNPLARLESAARLATSGRERATALSAYANLAASQDQGTTQRGIADVRDIGETKRNATTNAAAVTREKLGNATTERGQNITRDSQAATNKTSLGIAQLGADARKSASEMAADARLAAAEATAKRYIPVAGGQQVKDINGLPQVVTSPASVFDATTGRYVEAQPAGAGNIGAPQATPRADYDKMPKGTRYVGPDGKTYTKG